MNTYIVIINRSNDTVRCFKIDGKYHDILDGNNIVSIVQAENKAAAITKSYNNHLKCQAV